MIEINLLPENLRRSEGTPLPRQLAIYLGVALSLGLIFLNYHYFMKTQLANKELGQLKSEMAEVKEQEKELGRIEKEISGIEQHVAAVEKLYRERIVWAKLLQDLKSVIYAQGYNRSNSEGEYVWLEDLSLDSGGKSSDGPSQYLVLQGIASAQGTRKATKMVQDLLASMVSHKPDDLADEEKTDKNKSDEEIAEQALLEKESAGTELSAEEKRRLEAIKERQEFSQRHHNGGIAEKGFYDFFAEGARTVETDWNSGLGSSKKGEGAMENMPQQGMDFEIRLGFKPKVKVEETKKRGF